ncbi:probable 2-oxoglutarate-dependent dioxygenase AOP1 [Rhodamnia argentea]|uniref:Probable 2-oxoglutarate-dependent dioxygenase AOP1 n=1 Tax=Rhodamnia argentea TaxID=178133 RepID=A0ABM3GZF3_9MYRT|nr:probable 2-oxoglutarate-dependent dioxygenase AOP1 [Rhodamnia argentea]
MASKVPVIVFSEESTGPRTKSWMRACDEIVQALEHHGCFIAEYEGFRPELRDPIFGVAKELFDLPHETKVRSPDSSYSKGYIPHYPGTPLLEGLNFDGAEKLDACEKFTALMWPSGNARFCKAAYSYASAIAKLEKLVTRMVFEGYGAGKYCDSHTESTAYVLRFLKYKKPGEDGGNAYQIAHTDKTFLSILHQNNVRGLEVMTKDGEWVTFEPSPSSFMVMAGDACMGWSNGRIKACYHKVDVQEERLVRYSVGFFSYNTGKIEIPKELIDQDHPQQFKSFSHLDFLRFYHKIDGHTKLQSQIKVYCGV